MLRLTIILSVLIVSFSGCNTKVTGKDCQALYDEYYKYRLGNNIEIAISSLNKAIKCDSSNQEYRFEKINFLVALERYEEAIVEVQRLSKINPKYETQFPLLGLLTIATGKNQQGKAVLKDVYDNLKGISFDKDNFELFYSKVALQSYFVGRKKTVEEIKNHFAIYREKHQQDNLERLINLIENNREPLAVLNKLYGIN